MQTHVNEVTVSHTLVNTINFLVVISKHGTPCGTDTKGELWYGASWVIRPLEGADGV